MSATEEFWSGTFGREYTERNRVDWRARVPFWRKIITLTRPDDVLEVGCNLGWNLKAIREISPGVGVHGVEINRRVANEGRLRSGLDITGGCSASDFAPTHQTDLVFTAGVLIHIATAELSAAMQNIARASRKYVLAIEYDADAEEEVEYRGHAGRLWKRPFGRLYAAMGLKPVADGVADGFDRCHWWLLEKP